APNAGEAAADFQLARVAAGPAWTGGQNSRGCVRKEDVGVRHQCKWCGVSGWPGRRRGPCSGEERDPPRRSGSPAFPGSERYSVEADGQWRIAAVEIGT